MAKKTVILYTSDTKDEAIPYITDANVFLWNGKNLKEEIEELEKRLQILESKSNE